MPFTHEVTVRFSDTDAMGHVNNARFLTFLEEARIAWFSSAAAAETFLARGLVVARVEADLVRPVFHGAPVIVAVSVDRIGRSSFDLSYDVTQRGQQVCRARTVQVGYDYASGRSRPLEDDERAALEAQLAQATGR